MKHRKTDRTISPGNPARSLPETPRRVRKTRAQKKEEKNRILPVHKRPVVCPPDRSGRKRLFCIGGLLCRLLVIWAASSGFSLFVSDAFRFDVPHRVIFLSSLLVTVLALAAFQGTVGKIVSLVGAGGAVGALFAGIPSLIPDIGNGMLSLYNAVLDRLYRAGYMTYLQYQVTVHSDTPHETLMAVGMGLLTVLFTAIFALSLGRKVHLLPPAVVSGTVIVVILTFNLYSNRHTTNLGVTLLIVAFASVLIMAAYDKLYRVRDDRRFDTGMKLFPDSDRPEEPEKVFTFRGKTPETSPSATSGSPGKPASVPDARSRRDEKQARRNWKKSWKAVHRYDRITEESRMAMSGYAAGAAFGLFLLVIALPAALIKGNFTTIPAIDEKLEFARDYVTATLRGDEHQLDRLDYQGHAANFRPHKTELEQISYTGKQVFYLKARYKTDYYLRGFIGTDYEDGAWMPVSDDLLKHYHTQFGMEANPGDESRYRFYHYMKPELVDNPEYTGHYLDKYQSNLPYGFVNLLVSMRRVNSPSSDAYFPTSFNPFMGVYDFHSTEKSRLTYVNYYDGIYTGRKFHKNGASYATVAYAPVMTDPNWISHQSALQARFNLRKEALLIQSALETVGTDGARDGLYFMTEERKDGMTMFVYMLRYKDEETIFRSYHLTHQVRKVHGLYTVDTADGTLQLTLSRDRITGVILKEKDGNEARPYVKYFPKNDETDRNGEIAEPLPEKELSEEEKEENRRKEEEKQELFAWMQTDRAYNDFVYDTYTKPSGSAYLHELAETIRRQAHIHVSPDTTNTTPKESGNTSVQIPVDVSLAARPNTSNPDVYIQRDRLVRNVIDYIITDMACTYTLTPDLTKVDPALDGVGNFLRNTKQGYCVQFASAAALILRELGIPVRYVEGYIAADLQSVSTQTFEYGGYVRDQHAHAWIEVYYDGVGWIPYETTPVYYTDMYGVTDIGGTTPLPEPPGTETTPEQPEPPEPDHPVLPGEDDSETEPSGTTSDETTSPEDAMAEKVTKNGLIGLGILILLSVIFAVIRHVVVSARVAEQRRQDMVGQILDEHFGEHTNETDLRDMASEVSGYVSGLLRYFGLAPEKGEFREEYAERLTGQLTVPPEKARDTDPVLPDLHLVLSAMAAEEFGHGMSLAGMKAVAAFYLFLHAQVKRRIPWTSRFSLHYFQRKI